MLGRTEANRPVAERERRGQRITWCLRSAWITLAFLFSAGAPSLQARDAFVMLSGGVSPFDNNYSQYLQAKAVVTFFEKNYPRDSVWVFFGAGNIEGAAPIFCDVRREMKRDGLAVNSWLVGSLSHNRPARRDVILRTLREEILPAIADGGTLYLFVGDHGSQTRTNGESVIDLWSLERDAKNERGWRPTRDESLTVSELRRVLASGMGEGRVVFCMTQCHSGGFHYLAMPREMTANPKWFTTPPSWLSTGAAAPTFPRVAGFTATDERSLAAGCQADPDPANWAGYERFAPEHLLGMNLFTLQRTEKGLHSFAEAHIAATLADQTIDKPYSTSEQYLERWANLIETRLAKSTTLTEPMKRRVAAYQRTVDGVVPKEADRAFRQRQALFRQFTEKLIEQNPAVKDLLRTGARKDLEQAMGMRGRGTNSTPLRQTNSPSRNVTQRSPSRRATTNAPSETIKLWTEALRPAWQAALERDAVSHVVGAASEFEKYLLSKESKDREFFSTASRGRLQEESFWHSGYSDPEHLDANKAEAVILWGLTRRAKIVAWAKTCDDESARAAAEKLLQRTPQRSNALSVAGPPTLSRTNQLLTTNSTKSPVSKRIAAERVLFYRRVLAAWEFLLDVNERPALARVRELTELERTPLPRFQQ